jgi:hypothetical protein
VLLQANHSNLRLIISGNTAELYEYKQPYFYNWSPTKRHGSWGTTHEKRADNIQRSKMSIQRIVNCNLQQQHRLKFCTYTFKDEIQDLSIANPFFTSHIKEVRRIYGNIKYLTVPEYHPGGHGIHFHTLFFNLPYIQDKKEWSYRWPYGHSKLEAVRKPSSIGGYVAKYLTKALHDKRLTERKSFFTSRNLLRPITIYDERRVQDWLWEHDTIIKTYESQFVDYRDRDVTYKVFTIPTIDTI